jgi:hypothetical protein
MQEHFAQREFGTVHFDGQGVTCEVGCIVDG